MRKHHQGRGHPPALLFLGVQIASAALFWTCSAMATTPPTKLLAENLNSRAPVAFRMDALTANLKGREVSGMGNVVVRQDVWLLCCDRFEAQSDADGVWRHMRCLGRVRGYYGGRKLWANRADFAPEAHTLTLLGKPVITQGRGLLGGTKMTVQTDSHEVNIVGPKGTMSPASMQNNTAAPAPSFLSQPLPDICPWPWEPVPGISSAQAHNHE